MDILEHVNNILDQVSCVFVEKIKIFIIFSTFPAYYIANTTKRVQFHRVYQQNLPQRTISVQY